jgi:hypothetical protein
MAPDDQHAVLIRVRLEITPLMLAVGLPELLGDIDAAPGADDLLHLRGAPVPGDVEELLLGFRCRHSGDGSRFGVRNLAAPKGLADARKLLQGSGHAHLFTGCAQVEAGPPAQPVCAGATGSVVPASSPVVFRDEHEKPVGSGVDRRGKLRDFVLQAAQLLLRLSDFGWYLTLRHECLARVYETSPPEYKRTFFFALLWPSSGDVWPVDCFRLGTWSTVGNANYALLEWQSSRAGVSNK